MATPFQRHVADRPETLHKQIAHDLERLAALEEAGDSEGATRLSGKIGEAYRMVGDNQAAIRYLTAALDEADWRDNAPQQAVNLIRLATAVQYSGQHDEAEPLFQQAVASSREVGRYEDYALQHYGKCLIEMGRLDEAESYLQAALQLREGSGDKGLLNATRSALRGLQKLRDQQNTQG